MERAKAAEKMVRFYGGNLEDINHFLKVHAFAAMIGKLEGLDDEGQAALELAAIVHDIACPLCREKYGNTNGRHQQEESEALLREFLAEFALPAGRLERVVSLVTRHHTYSGVDGLDCQILLEADFLANAGETEKYARVVRQFRERVFRTETGKRLLEGMYLGGE